MFHVKHGFPFYKAGGLCYGHDVDVFKEIEPLSHLLSSFQDLFEAEMKIITPSFNRGGDFH